MNINYSFKNAEVNKIQLLAIRAIDALGNVTFSEALELVNAREFGTPIATLTGPVTGYEGQAFSVSFSPDGRLLASGGIESLIRLWDVSSGELVATLTAHEDGLYPAVLPAAGFGGI